MAIVKAGRNYVGSLPNSSPTCFDDITLDSAQGTITLSDPPVAVFVGTAGNIKIVGKDGVSSIFPATVGQNNISPSAIIDDADTTARDVTLGYYHKES